MQPDTSERGDALVEHLPVQRVPKDIFRVDIAQPALPARKLRARFGQGSDVAFQHPRNRGEPKLDAAYARRLQQRPLVRRELPDVALDDPGQALRNRH